MWIRSRRTTGGLLGEPGAGARVAYLPPFSPDLNPIETVISKFKSLLRTAAERTVEVVWNTCGKLLDKLSEPECRTHIRHCGYRYI
jgi:transposase